MLVAVLSLSTTISVSDVAECECEGRGEFAEHAGAFDLVGLGESDAFVESGVAGADLLGGVEQDSHLDDRGGLHGLVGQQRCGLAGSQIVRVERDLAVMGGSNGFDLRVELGVFLGGDRKDTEESEDPAGDSNAAPDISHAVQGNASGGLNVDALSQRSKGGNHELDLRCHSERRKLGAPRSGVSGAKDLLLLLSCVSARL